MAGERHHRGYDRAPPTGFYGCGVQGFNTGIGGSYDCNPIGPLKISKSIYNDPTYGPDNPMV